MGSMERHTIGKFSMDERTHFALTLILTFVAGLLIGVGNRVVGEANGREIKIIENNALKFVFLLFYFIGIGYGIALIGEIKILSLVFAIMVASIIFGISCGSKLAVVRNKQEVQWLLFCLGGSLPLMFHYVLS